MSTDKLRMVMKAFIESQFGYCPLVWMFHSRTLNNRINQLHERALWLDYKDTQSSFEDLLLNDKSFTIHHRNFQKLAMEMLKVKNNLSPSFMINVFPETTNPYNLPNAPTFNVSNTHTIYNCTETIFFRGPKTWAILSNDIKQSKLLADFQTWRMCVDCVHS